MKKDITELKKEGKKMKKKGICLVLAMMLILGVVGSTALAANRPASVVSTEVIALVQGGINLEYEKVLNPGMSLYAAPTVSSGGGVTGLGVVAGIKKYFKPTAPEGFWLGGFGNFGYIFGFGISVTVFGGGANVGYKYFLTDRFTLEGSVGLAYEYLSLGILGGAGVFGTTYGVNIGYAF